jgi:tetratricopeptide (TPR) repeat protein
MQPSPPNPDNEQSGVQQEISDGSSNHGLMQGADVGRDSNQISGNSNRISQSQSTQNFFIIPTPEPSKLASRSRKTFRFLRERPKVVVSLVLIPILGVTAVSIPQVRDELLYGELRCFKEARKEGKKAIAFAKFHNDLGSLIIQPQIENEIRERLKEPILQNVRICSIDKSLSLRDDAQKLGNDLKASVVIWGSRSGSTLKVNVTPVKTNVTSLAPLSLSAANDLEFSRQTKDWPYLVSVMTAYSMSKIYDQEGQGNEALETLQKALSSEELRNLDHKDENTTKILSSSYYFLGDLYAPQKNWNCSNKNITNKCKAALTAYQKAFNRRPSFYEALRKQGELYTRLDNLSEAKKIYLQIIDRVPENKSDLKLMVRVSLANIYLQQGDALKAVAELNFVCQKDPSNIDYLHYLGLAQLQAKQTSDAMKTYQDIKPYLSQDKVLENIVLRDLQLLAKEREDLFTDIQTVIAAFKG